jgi:hypothetical protein
MSHIALCPIEGRSCQQVRVIVFGKKTAQKGTFFGCEKERRGGTCLSLPPPLVFLGMNSDNIYQDRLGTNR